MSRDTVWVQTFFKEYQRWLHNETVRNGLITEQEFSEGKHEVIKRACRRADLDKYINGKDDPNTFNEILERASSSAENARQRGTAERWEKIRIRIYDRDSGVCQVCQKPVEFSGGYNCGHKVDRLIGGTDTDDNLVVMCGQCNQLKPIHETIEQYQAWVDSGYWLSEYKAWYKTQWG